MQPPVSRHLPQADISCKWTLCWGPEGVCLQGVRLYYAFWWSLKSPYILMNEFSTTSSQTTAQLLLIVHVLESTVCHGQYMHAPCPSGFCTVSSFTRADKRDQTTYCNAPQLSMAGKNNNTRWNFLVRPVHMIILLYPGGGRRKYRLNFVADVPFTDRYYSAPYKLVSSSLL